MHSLIVESEAEETEKIAALIASGRGREGRPVPRQHDCLSARGELKPEDRSRCVSWKDYSWPLGTHEANLRKLGVIP